MTIQREKVFIDKAVKNPVWRIQQA